MKIRHVRIEHFKGIEELDLSFVDAYTDKVRPITAILGDNGSGKTSILQAIALTISMATRKTLFPDQFQWHGFMADRMDLQARTKIVVQIELSDQELQSVHEVFEMWKETLDDTIHPMRPGNEKLITLTYEKGQVTADGGDQNKFVMFGRYYIKSLLKFKKPIRTYFDEVGDIFWFDQFRNLGQGVHVSDGEEKVDKEWKAGIEVLRKHLVGWWRRSKERPNSSINYMPKLEEKFSRIFPSVRVKGIDPMHDLAIENDEHYFLLSREVSPGKEKIYDFSEMSSGEQNIFSLLYVFIRMHIAHSIVLIDELELHLHPPEQQALYSALRHFADDCQFIITTHSNYLSDIIPDQCVYRLEGGRLCL